ncbi:MAG: MptD family putative ECF transporter S component [Coprococcus sp.]
MSKKKNSNVLKGLIRIGIFSALWVVVAFLIGCTIGFLPPVLIVMPCILGIVGGIIYMAMFSKLEIKGGIVISSALLGICLFTMAPYGMMFFCTLSGGIIGEVLMAVIGKDKFIAKAIGSSMALLGLAFGEYLPFICMKEAYTALYADSSFGTGPILDKVMNAVNVPVMIVLMIATVICTFAGCWIGDKIVKKHLKK